MISDSLQAAIDIVDQAIELQAQKNAPANPLPLRDDGSAVTPPVSKNTTRTRATKALA